MSKKVIIAYKDLKTGEATDALELGYPLSKYYSNDSYVNNYRNYAYLRLGISTNALVVFIIILDIESRRNTRRCN